jgi:type II secretory pathway predicted ATPase ExeA/outer membrane protein OmpA-like peptidoglycan-associated protein
MEPFSISPDSRFLWLGEKHSEALATLKYGIQANIGFLLLTGGIGTGKTALINRLIREIDIPTLVATIPDPGLNTIDFFNYLAFKFNINRKFNSKGSFLIFFRKFIKIAYALNQKVLIIIDEAQRLSTELLEEIRQLSNIELDHIKLLNIFYVGQSEFNKFLIKEINKATWQRIAVKYHIEPLTQKETAMYIRHRLKVAGATGEIFNPKAIKEIYNFSGGYPRMINIICGHSMLIGYSEELKSINEFVIRACATGLNIQNYVKEKREDNLPFLHKKRIQKANKTYKLQSWRNKILTVAVLSKPEEDFIKSNLKSLFRFIKQSEHIRVGKGEEFTETPYVIYFKYNSIELLNWSFQVLNQIVIYYLKYPKLEISIEGYTDSCGNYWYNKKLTRYRADIVKNLLIRKGVSPVNIKVFGNKPEDQISSQVKPAGRIIKNYSAVIEFPY